MGLIAGLTAVVALLPIIFGINRGLEVPESAQCYGGKVYISNVGKGAPHSKDGNGYISLADKKGNILKQKFIAGLNGPKGIAFYNGRLFTADIDRVVVADAQTGKVLAKVNIPGARFLNDVVCNRRGKVYISDTQTNTIYEMDAQSLKVSVFLRSPELQGPNGLAFLPDGKLLIASWGGGKLLTFDGRKLKTLASGFKNLDGVVVLKDGSIVFSDFSAGKVYRLKGGKLQEIYNGFYPADIGYCGGLLLVPEFMMNSVKAVEIK